MMKFRTLPVKARPGKPNFFCSKNGLEKKSWLCSHFKDKRLEAQEGEMACLPFLSQWVHDRAGIGNLVV